MEELVLCLVEMEEKEATEHESEMWTNTIDRGGLKHVSNMTYMMFMSMELELRQQLHSGCASEETAMKEKAIEKISQNDDVLFYWSVVSTDWEEEADALLPMIIEHWVTVRGFSFTSAFLEKYSKQARRVCKSLKELEKTSFLKLILNLMSNFLLFITIFIIDMRR